MGLASQLVAGIGRLFSGEIALLPFDAFEERSRNVLFGATNHCTNIQIICMNMQGCLIGNLESTKRRKQADEPACTLLALLRKLLIINGAGEGNRTLVCVVQNGAELRKLVDRLWPRALTNWYTTDRFNSSAQKPLLW